jgi:hypothetical protein
MSFSEKPDDEYSQKQSEQENNEDITNIEENQRNSINSSGNNINIPTKKKNRTLQYYKFLFYSMKTEIKVHDFLKLLRNSNTAELSLWTISVVLFANIPKNFPVLKEGEISKAKYSGVFLWFHIIHVLRACLGMYVGYKLPRSYQIMDILQNITNEKLAKTLFNDIMRETLLKNAVFVIKERKVLIFAYFIITIINTIIDIIDFLVVLVNISKCAASAKVVFITYLIIAIIYLVIDLAYFFWGGQLKYIFPPDYLKPITDLYHGIIDRTIMIFKLDKHKTNIVSEAKAQRSNGPYVTDSGNMNNGGINLLEYIMKDSLGVYNGEERSNKYLPEFINQVKNKDNIRYNISENNNYPNSNEILN